MISGLFIVPIIERVPGASVTGVVGPLGLIHQGLLGSLF
jgi:hypothetical protein